MIVLASDFDNTLYVQDKEVLDENIKSIKQFMVEGKVFCIITGRNYPSIKQMTNKYHIPYSYLICQDGGKIFNSVDNCIKTNYVNPDQIGIIEEILNKNGYSCTLDDGYNTTQNINDCVKVVAEYKNRQDADQVIAEVKTKADIYGYTSSAHINICNPDVHKSNALYQLADLEHFNTDDIYVIGDEMNDFEMLREFKGGIMKDHNPELDVLNKQSYETLGAYIKELRRK